MCVAALGCAACRPRPSAQPGVEPPPTQAVRTDSAVESLERAPMLERRTLVCAVLERNPDLAAAEDALRAARARSRTPIAASGTRLSWSVAPVSIGSDVPFGHIVEVEQSVRLGQWRLEREVARNLAESVAHGRDAVRNELALEAATLYDEHYELARALETNTAHRVLLSELVDAATHRFMSGKVPAQDPLQAELELVRVEEERIELEAQRRVVIARTNRLLHREPAASLPAAPDRLEPEGEAVDEVKLRDEALASRPELRAAGREVDARDRAVRLARRRFAPDVSAMASYNSMWADPEHRFMLGVGLSLPLQVGALRAGVSEARAETRRARNLEAAAHDRVAAEVEEALARLSSTEAVVRLHRERLLPTARERVEAARIGYESGANDIDSLIDAARELRAVELTSQRALAELDRRRAELDWAVGRPPCAAKEQRP